MDSTTNVVLLPPHRILADCTSLFDEIRGALDTLRAYLAKEISSLLEAAEFLDALPGHLPGDFASQSRVPVVTEPFERLAQL